jgi:hypothetical protein
MSFPFFSKREEAMYRNLYFKDSHDSRKLELFTLAIAFPYDKSTDVCHSIDIGALVNITTSTSTKSKVLQTSNIVALANMPWQQFFYQDIHHVQPDTIERMILSLMKI